jgi:arylsulfatase
MKANKDRPNILHLFTDMQRWDTIASLGNPVIKTPSLDRLVASGVAFTNAFSPSPVCISARCSMIHGQYPMHTGCYENTTMPTDGRETFMEALTRSGYRTHGIGKCHFTPDRYALRGFQSREVQEEGGVKADQLDRNPYLRMLREKGYDHVTEAYGVRGEMYYIPQISQVPAEDHPSRWIGDRGIEFIQRSPGCAPTAEGGIVSGPPEPDQPWYLFASFIHPHPPFTPPAPWHKLYRPSLMPLPLVPDGYESLLTYVNRAQNRYKYRDQGGDNNLARAIVAYYYACISFVDFQIGRMLDALEATGQRENTLVVFTSDHGEFLGQNRCYGKRSMHDPASRVPMLVSLPGRFEGGRILERPVSLVDLAPTFLEVAGASIRSHELDGEDLYRFVSGTSDRYYVFSQLSFHQDGMNRMVQGGWYDRADLPGDDQWSRERIAAFSSYMAVSADWKYVYSAPDDREFFFDRRRDPDETRNRVGVEFVKPELAKHKSALIKHLEAGGATAGLDGDDWRGFPRQEVSSDPDTGLLIQDGYTPWAEMEIPGYTT